MLPRSVSILVGSEHRSLQWAGGGVILAALGELRLWSLPAATGGLAWAGVAGLLIALQALPLAGAGRRPLVAFVVSAGAVLVSQALGFQLAYASLAPLVIAVVLFAKGRLATAAPAAVLYAAGVAGWDLAQPSHPAAWLGATVGVVPGAALVGLAIRAYRLRADAEREVRELREREVRAAARLQLARDLHDSVGHGLTLATLRAEAASQLLVDDPTRARELLAGMAESGRRAVGQLQELVGLLRDPAEACRESEEPLELLAQRFSSADLDVAVERHGEPVGLSAEAEAACRRIVAEGLANIVRHARARHGTVRLEYRPDGLCVEVLDDGCGPGPGQLAGFGLTGAAERARALGGSLRFEPRPDGGAVLSALIPYLSALP